MCSEVSVNSAWNLWSQSGRRKGRLRREGKVQPRVVKVTGLKAASLPRTDHLIVFARWRLLTLTRADSRGTKEPCIGWG